MSEPLPTPITGSLRDGVHYYPVRVFYEDTDLTGVVYHANYLRWFERARSDLLDVLGVDQRAAMEAGEGHYAISDLSIRYAAPARLSDAVLVETRSNRIARSFVEMNQRATRDGDLLAEMDIRVAFVSPEGRPRRQPESWLAAFDTLSPLT
ncbi:YbgC/FadM family acyl-CoA thioesterase [Croceicoccus naphthovorans]|uniref:Thioesterase n=2 Tax=Croceicoccus naphthovorans TaxID=1348774 RepID=A0A0G3XLX8_9SPHN|nr:YbgC/FadM family acyl-CoA thioesterase [Croceicoccus naphthovorans]AKM11626.1 thioesterase [Croceicoccus naphthovorans]MBB3991278.1 acyl-CoA thioester hydrolase [Croceicoccus naphthovorans]